MYSSKDFEKYHASKSRRKFAFIMPSAAIYYVIQFFRYQVEGIPKDESIESFCMRNIVPYNFFFKWYRERRKTISPVTIDGNHEAEGEKDETLEKK